MSALLSIHLRTSVGITTLLMLAVAVPVRAQNNEKSNDHPDVAVLVQKWEKDVRANLDKDAAAKALAAKYPLVVLHSRAKYAGGDYKLSAYSFIYETALDNKHFNDVQILFDNGDGDKFQINMLNGQHNFVVELGKVDFEKDPDPSKISIDHPGLVIDHAKAVEGNVYLERVRDDRGNSFYVVLKIVAVDRDNRYMGFLWRKLPGGKVVKRQAPPPRPMPRTFLDDRARRDKLFAQASG